MYKVRKERERWRERREKEWETRLSYLSSVDLSNGLHALMMSLAVYRASYARGESLGRYCAITMTHACIA